MKTLGFIYNLRWSNPYTEPPNGQPRTIAERFVPVEHPGAGAPGCPEEIEALYQAGSGYVISITPVSQLPHQLPPERLAAIRQKRIRSRMKKRYPLFADLFIREAIAEKPEYYLEGKTDPALQAAKDAVIQDEIERRRRLGIA